VREFKGKLKTLNIELLEDVEKRQKGAGKEGVRERERD
jgi:hypothetical protein